MTEPIVLDMSTHPGGGLTVHVRPGFELLGTYLSSDFRGLAAGPYQTVRSVLEDALTGGEGDEVVSDGFALTVGGATTTLTLLYDEARTATYSTADVLKAVTEYAEQLPVKAPREP